MASTIFRQVDFPRYLPGIATTAAAQVSYESSFFDHRLTVLRRVFRSSSSSSPTRSSSEKTRKLIEERPYWKDSNRSDTLSSQFAGLYISILGSMNVIAISLCRYCCFLEKTNSFDEARDSTFLLSFRASGFWSSN